MATAVPMFVYVVALGIAPCCWDHFLPFIQSLTPQSIPLAVADFAFVLCWLPACVCASANGCICMFNVHGINIIDKQMCVQDTSHFTNATCVSAFLFLSIRIATFQSFIDLLDWKSWRELCWFFKTLNSNFDGISGRRKCFIFGKSFWFP